MAKGKRKRSQRRPIAERQRRPKPTPVAEREMPEMPAEWADKADKTIGELDEDELEKLFPLSQPMKEAVRLAQERSSPMKEAVRLAQERSSPMKEAVRLAQERSSPMKEAVRLAQEKTGPSFASVFGEGPLTPEVKLDQFPRQRLRAGAAKVTGRKNRRAPPDDVFPAPSAGGRARAEMYRAVRAGWQKAAQPYWARNATRSKLAVATDVKRLLDIKLTAKHIARYIRRETSQKINWCRCAQMRAGA